MAAVVLLGTPTFDTNSGTKTVTATPSVGDLIVLVCAHTGNTATTAPTDNNSDGLGTYSLAVTAVKTTSADTMKLWVRDALIGSATSTVFTTAPGTTTGGGLAVVKVTGMSNTGSAAIAKTGKTDNLATGNTPAPSWTGGGSASGTNPLIGALFQGNVNGGTKPASFDTEECDVTYSTPSAGLEVVSDDTGNTDSTVTWGAVTGGAQSAVAILELDSTSAATNLSATAGSVVIAGGVATLTNKPSATAGSVVVAGGTAFLTTKLNATELAVSQNTGAIGFRIADDVSREMLGQSFQLVVAGNENGVDLYVMSRTGSPGDSILVELVDTDIGTGSVLASASTLASVLNTGALNRFSFTPAGLAASTTYYIRISRTGAVDAVNYVTLGGTGDVYAAGEQYVRVSGTWQGSSSDLRFQVITQVGTLTISGGTATFTVAPAAVNLPAVAGSIVISGGTATQTTALPGIAGSATLSGGTATLSIREPAVAGSLVVAGGTALLGIAEPATAGTLTLVGGAALLGVREPATAGSVVLAGGTATLSIIEPAAAGTLTITGGTATVVVVRYLPAVAGSLVAAGGTALFTVSLAHVAGTLVVSGGTALLRVSVPALAGSIVLTGGTATATSSQPLPAVAGSIVLSGGTATLAWSLSAVAGSIVIVGGTASPSVPLSATAGSVTIAGGTATAVRGLPALAGTATLAGGTAVLADTLAALAGSVVIAGGTATAAQAIGLTATAGSLSAAGGTALLTTAEGAQAGSVVLTGGTAVLSAALVATAGSVVLEGGTATLNIATAPIVRVQAPTPGTSTGGASVSATWDQDTIAGHLAFAAVTQWVLMTGAPTFTAPAGWTPLTLVSVDAGVACRLYYSTAVHSGIETFTSDKTQDMSLHLVEYSGINATPFDVETGSFSAGSTAASTGTTGGTSVTTSVTLAIIVNRNAGTSQSAAAGTPTGAFATVSAATSGNATPSLAVRSYLYEDLTTATGTAETHSTLSTSRAWAAAIAVFKGNAGAALSATAGDLVLEGGSASLSVSLSATAGSVVISGGTALATSSQPLPALAGSIVVSGGTALLSRSLAAVAGSVVISGGADALGRSLPASAGSVVIQGGTATLSSAGSLGAVAGSISIAGGQAALTRRIGATAGALELVGGAALLAGDLFLQAVSGAIVISGGTATLFPVSRIHLFAAYHAIAEHGAAYNPSLSKGAAHHPLIEHEGASNPLVQRQGADNPALTKTGAWVS